MRGCQYGVELLDHVCLIVKFPIGLFVRGFVCERVFVGLIFLFHSEIVIFRFFVDI